MRATTGGGAWYLSDNGTAVHSFENLTMGSVKLLLDVRTFVRVPLGVFIQQPYSFSVDAVNFGGAGT